jgi:hypothetical protein
MYLFVLESSDTTAMVEITPEYLLVVKLSFFLLAVTFRAVIYVWLLISASNFS